MTISSPPNALDGASGADVDTSGERIVDLEGREVGRRGQIRRRAEAKVVLELVSLKPEALLRLGQRRRLHREQQLLRVEQLCRHDKELARADRVARLRRCHCGNARVLRRHPLELRAEARR